MSKKVDYEILSDISLKNLLQRFQSSMLESLNCVKVGKIKTFYSDKQTADIQIDNYPQISGVPVKFICGADFSIQIPIKSGDDCIVLFCDTDLDNWVEGKGSSPAFPADKHGLNGAIALVGITNLNTRINDYITDGVRIKYKGSIIELKDSGIEIIGNLKVTGTIETQDVKTNIVTSLNTHVHGGVTTGSGVTGTPQ